MGIVLRDQARGKGKRGRGNGRGGSGRVDGLAIGVRVSLVYDDGLQGLSMMLRLDEL